MSPVHGRVVRVSRHRCLLPCHRHRKRITPRLGNHVSCPPAEPPATPARLPPAPRCSRVNARATFTSQAASPRRSLPATPGRPTPPPAGQARRPSVFPCTADMRAADSTAAASFAPGQPGCPGGRRAGRGRLQVPLSLDGQCRVPDPDNLPVQPVSGRPEAIQRRCVNFLDGFAHTHPQRPELPVSTPGHQRRAGRAALVQHQESERLPLTPAHRAAGRIPRSRPTPTGCGGAAGRSRCWRRRRRSRFGYGSAGLR